MYRLDKTYFKAQTFEEAERSNLFSKSDSLTERLNQAWFLTATIFGIDPLNPPSMKKNVVTVRKHKK